MYLKDLEMVLASGGDHPSSLLILLGRQFAPTTLLYGTSLILILSAFVVSRQLSTVSRTRSFLIHILQGMAIFDPEVSTET